MTEKKKAEEKCVLCGRSRSEVEFLIKGLEGYVCNSCIKTCSFINDVIECYEHKD